MELIRKKQTGRESDITVLKKLFARYAKHNKSTIVVCIFLALVDGIRPYITIILSGVLIDGLADGRDFTTLISWMAMGLAAVFFMQILSNYLREYFNARVENCMERQNRDMNETSMQIDYEHLENQEIQAKKRKQEQVVNARGGIYWMLIWPLDRGLTGFIQVITALVTALPLFLGGGDNTHGIWGSGWTSLLLVVLLGASVYASYGVDRQLNKKGKKAFDQYADCNKVSNYLLHNIIFGNETGKDLRIFHQEKLIEEGVHAREGEAAEALKKARGIYMTKDGLERTFSNLCCGFVYFYATMKAYLGIISIGSVVQYAASILKCVEGLSEVMYALSAWRNAADYGREYLDYVNFENRKYQGTLPIEKRRDNRFLVEFDHVSFCYPGSDKYVIRDLNLKLDIGEKMAIVGRNGSGKTTFIKLLCRLYDVTEGTIRLNGIDIRKYDYQEYMDLFSVVFQDYRMFSLKLGENIAASEKVDEEKARDALIRAGLEERLENLPKGLDTYIGKEFDELGVNASGGERQKMAIARAIYKGAPFVIMDEPTAALDPVSECEVYAGFDKMVGNKTAIYISHRLASCRFCNDILVFDAGNVAQRGSHEELIMQDGLYQKLWNAQAQYYEV